MRSTNTGGPDCGRRPTLLADIRDALRDISSQLDDITSMGSDLENVVRTLDGFDYDGKRVPGIWDMVHSLTE